MPNAVLTTFAVSPVTPETAPLPETSYAGAIEAALAGGINRAMLHRTKAPPPVTLESCSRRTEPLVEHIAFHPFVAAAHWAFAQHRPLTLSPDMIWLLISQGFALHVRSDAEEPRLRLVPHQGKKRLDVQRDDFTRGFAGNDWEAVFAAFSEQIRRRIGDEIHALLVPEFSTTGLAEKAATEIALMDVLAPYFDYIFTTLCGIPSITLEGTPEDWASLRRRAGDLTGFGCDWWLAYLLPVLDQFARASRGDVDTDFWRSFFKVGDESGGPYINGHILALLPYTPQEGDKPRRNVYLGVDPVRPRDGLTTDDLPSGLSQVPFRWQYHQEVIPMQFLAGYVGVAQDPVTRALRPEIGWAVCESPPGGPA